MQVLQAIAITPIIAYLYTCNWLLSPNPIDLQPALRRLLLRILCCCSTSEVDPAMLNELLSDIAPRYRPQDYSLLTHNCNHFSNELVQLLTGESVPVSEQQ
jgi:hypothetical protein